MREARSGEEDDGDNERADDDFDKLACGFEEDEGEEEQEDEAAEADGEDAEEFCW